MRPKATRPTEIKTKMVYFAYSYLDSLFQIGFPKRRLTEI
jgi:hypothetical protein